MERILSSLSATAFAGTDARRLFHGRGGCVPGCEFVNIDFYPPLAHVILYAEQSPAQVEALARELIRRADGNCSCIVVQERFRRDAPCRVVHGELPSRCVARENRLEFLLDFSHGRNIGFFPDMRNGRRLVRDLAPRRRVLNLFAYTGAFSVVAATGGANRVVNLDMSRSALQRAAANHRLNRIDPARISFLPHNLFKSFGRLRRLGPFDLVILDPPSDQGASFRAERDWPKLIRRLPEWLPAGGDILACLNAPHLPGAFLDDQFGHLLPAARRLGALPPPADFPETDPDRGLKIVHYRL